MYCIFTTQTGGSSSHAQGAKRMRVAPSSSHSGGPGGMMASDYPAQQVKVIIDF